MILIWTLLKVRFDHFVFPLRSYAAGAFYGKSPLYVTNLWHFQSSALILLKNTGIIRDIDGKITVHRRLGIPREKDIIEL